MITSHRYFALLQQRVVFHFAEPICHAEGRLAKEAKKAPPKRGFSSGWSRLAQSLLAADWRAMKLSKVFSTTRNHSTSSFRKAFHDS